MSSLSQWPLSPDAVRYITPAFMLAHLQHNLLTRACYPTAFGYYPVAKGHSMERIQPKDNLMMYCVEGCGYVTIDNIQNTVRQGDVLLLQEGKHHHYFSDSQHPWTIYWLHFDGLQTQQLIEEFDFSTDQVLVSVGLQPLLISDLKRLLSLRQSGYRPSVFNYAAALTRQILYFLALQIRSMNTLQRHNFNLDALHSLMLENINSDINLDMLAASTQLSRHHFATKYKKLTGISPIKHFIHLKMERACYLLDTGSYSAKEVSAQLGYNDPLYFSRIFKKVIGLSPSEYRRQQRG